MDEILTRHSVLRCALEYLDGGWRYLSGKAQPFRLGVFDRTSSEDDAIDLLSEFAWQPFRFDREGPLRAAVAEISEDHFLLCVVIHHSFADAYSMRICSHELAEAYHALSSQGAATSRRLPFQYLDYMISMEEWSEGSQARAHMRHWMQYLQGAHPLRPELGSRTEGGHFRLSGPLSAAAYDLCRAERIGANIAWECVHHVALSTLLGQRDVTSLSIDVGRRQKELVSMMGEFHNFITNRSIISGELTFRELLRTMQNARVESAPYLATPYHLVSDACPFSLAAQFGALNYIPNEYMPLPTFGEFVMLRPPDTITARIPFPYVVSVREAESDFLVGCTSSMRAPFDAHQLAGEMERAAIAAFSEPDRQIGAGTNGRHP